MADTREIQIKKLLSDPEKLLSKLPFTRGSSSFSVHDSEEGNDVDLNVTKVVKLPKISKNIITQERFLKELDPMCHDVLYDKNIPSICVKLEGGGYREIKFMNMPIGLQERIMAKNTLNLCGYPMSFTLMDSKPTQLQKDNCTLFKQYWELRNQDGMRTRMVATQLSMGDAGLLFYFDNEGCIKSRLLCYKDGYVLIPHNDQNGDRILESVYYADENGIEYIDSYDKTYMYRMTKGDTVDDNGNEWIMQEPIVHGFSEIPLITKRGDVAWNNVETLIEAFEILYNIFLVIQKRHGWGILYIRGKFSQEAKQIAGSIILNDKSHDGKGSAEFKTPPSPQGTIETLTNLFKHIQIGSSTTFILPEDVKTSGQISALAIKLAQSLDLEKATMAVIDWQNVADKMCRLFKEGLAKELVNKGISKTAVTDFKDLHLNAKFKVWQPLDDASYNQMLATLKQAGITSSKTAIEKCTVNAPDEEERVNEDIEREKQDTIDKMNANNGNGTNVDSNSNTAEGDNANPDANDANNNNA